MALSALGVEWRRLGWQQWVLARSGALRAGQNLTTAEKATYGLVATAIRETKRKPEKQSKLGVIVDAAQLALLGSLADRAQAVALGEEQPDLFPREAAK